MKRSLTKESFEKGLQVLARRDTDLSGIIETYGPPPMWTRKPGFATLLFIILEQQVSLASARAAYNRLLELAGRLTPRRFLDLDARSLRRVGFSRQKMGYARSLATSIVTGELDLAAVGRMPDGEARRVLLEQRGIGPWSADIYLLQALRRPDVWPSGDLALVVAIQELRGLDERPVRDQVEEIGEPWRPWRAVAARMLWHYYLSSRPGYGSNDML